MEQSFLLHFILGYKAVAKTGVHAVLVVCSLFIYTVIIHFVHAFAFLDGLPGLYQLGQQGEKDGGEDAGDDQ